MDAHLDVLLFEDVRGQLAEHVLRIPAPGYCVVDFRLLARSVAQLYRATTGFAPSMSSRRAATASVEAGPAPWRCAGNARTRLTETTKSRRTTETICELQVAINQLITTASVQIECGETRKNFAR